MCSSYVKLDSSGTYADYLYCAVILSGTSHPGERGRSKVMSLFASGSLVNMSYFHFPVRITLRLKYCNTSKKQYAQTLPWVTILTLVLFAKVPFLGCFWNFSNSACVVMYGGDVFPFCWCWCWRDDCIPAIWSFSLCVFEFYPAQKIYRIYLSGIWGHSRPPSIVAELRGVSCCWIKPAETSRCWSHQSLHGHLPLLKIPVWKVLLLLAFSPTANIFCELFQFAPHRWQTKPPQIPWCPRRWFSCIALPFLPLGWFIFQMFLFPHTTKTSGKSVLQVFKIW